MDAYAAAAKKDVEEDSVGAEQRLAVVVWCGVVCHVRIWGLRMGIPVVVVVVFVCLCRYMCLVTRHLVACYEVLGGRFE